MLLFRLFVILANVQVLWGGRTRKGRDFVADGISDLLVYGFGFHYVDWEIEVPTTPQVATWSSKFAVRMVQNRS